MQPSPPAEEEMRDFVYEQNQTPTSDAAIGQSRDVSCRDRSQTTMPFPTSIHPQTHFHTSSSEVCTLHSSPPVYFSLPHYVPLPPVPDRDLLMKVTFQLPSPTVMFCYYVISVSVALAAVDSSVLPYTLCSAGFLPSLLFFLSFFLVSYVSIFPYS